MRKILVLFVTSVFTLLPIHSHARECVCKVDRDPIINKFYFETMCDLMDDGKTLNSEIEIVEVGKYSIKNGNTRVYGFANIGSAYDNMLRYLGTTDMCKN